MAPRRTVDNRTPDGELACAFGSPWMTSRRVGLYHCATCARHGLMLMQQFHEAVERGEYDEQGYTPAERREKDIKDRWKIPED